MGHMLQLPLNGKQAVVNTDHISLIEPWEDPGDRLSNQSAKTCVSLSKGTYVFTDLTFEDVLSMMQAAGSRLITADVYAPRAHFSED